MQIHCTHPDHICYMIMEEITGDFQSDGIKRYIKNLVNYGLKSDGFFSMRKEIKDRITLIEYCNTGCRLDMDSSMEILCRINAIERAVKGAYNYRSLDAQLRMYAERVLLYALQSHFQKNNYNDWFEKRMKKAW